jgi:hypothetical protein
MNENLEKSFNPINRLQIFIGAVFLLIGGLTYLINRPPDLTYFVYRYSIILSLHNVLPKISVFWGNSLPDFIHVFSFILITAGIASCGKKGYLLISISWLFIDCAFELGQNYSSLALKIIPDWFSGVSILEAMEGYFRKGTFDFNDIVAVFLGATMAYLVLLVTIERRKRL